jgi:hypothetical protein
MAPGKFVFEDAMSKERLSFRPSKQGLNMKAVADAFQLKKLQLEEAEGDFVIVELSEPYDIDLLVERTGRSGTAASLYVVKGEPLQTGLADAGALFVEKIRKAGIANVKQNVVDRAIFYFSSQLQTVVMPSAPDYLAAQLYQQAAAQLGTLTRVNAVSEQRVSINGPLHNVSPYVLIGVDLNDGRPCLFKILPTQEKQQAEARQAECYDCAWLSLTALSTVTCNLWL